MLMNIKAYFLIFLCFIGSVQGVVFEVTTSGPFSFGVDIPYAPTDPNDCIILISANDVQLNGGNSTLYQTNTVANLAGIRISPGYSNISIDSVNFRDLTGEGIAVGAGCGNITVNNVRIKDIAGRGIDFQGTTTAPIENCTVQHCDIVGSCTNSTIGDAAIALNYCSNIKLTGLNIYENGNSGSDFSGVYINTCTNCSFSSNNILENTGLNVYGLNLINASRCQFNNDKITFNVPTSGGIFRAINMDNGYSVFNRFNNCFVEANVSTAHCIGIYIGDNCQDNTFNLCSIADNNGGIMEGIVLTGINNFNNIFTGCTITNNDASAGNSTTGIKIAGSDFGIIENCIISYNTSFTGIAAGLSVEPNGGANWTIRQNRFIRNQRTSGSLDQMNANSYGVRDQSIGGTSCLYIGNLAYNNGTNSGIRNQYFGLPFNVIFERTSKNLPAIGAIANVSVPA